MADSEQQESQQQQQNQIEEPLENKEPIESDNPELKTKENVKFSKDDTFTSVVGDVEATEEHIKEAKKKATPAVCKRRQATRHLVVQSPTDHIFSPCSQKLLQRKRTDHIDDY